MGAVDTTYTFTATDTITSGKMNNIIDQTVMTSDSVFAGGTIEVSGGKLRVRSGSITSNELSANSVTTNAITNSAVEPIKLSSGGPSWTASTTSLGSGVTGSYTASVTPSRTGDGQTTLQFGSQTAVSNNASITRNTGANGTFDITNAGTGAIKLTASGGTTFGSANMPTPSGNAPIYGIRAWVSFAGTTGAIRASGNVSSVSRTGTGRYTVNFITPMQNVNYAVVSSGGDTGLPRFSCAALTASTTSVQIQTSSQTGAAADLDNNYVMVIQ